MLAFGVTLLVSVAATPVAPLHLAEKLASTYDEATCDPSEGGECAQAIEEETLSLLPSLPAILDCASPFIQEMIGSCDLPQPTMPSLHLPTVRSGGSGFTAASNGGSERLTVVATASSLDAAMPFHAVALASPPLLARLSAWHDTGAPDRPRPRLDRPPRL